MHDLPGLEHYRFLKSASKGASSKLSLLSIFVPTQNDWSEFETLPEEIHLTDVAFEISQISNASTFYKEYRLFRDQTRKSESYDQHLGLFIDIPPMENPKNYFDYYFETIFNGEIDPTVVTSLRFKLSEFL